MWEYYHYPFIIIIVNYVILCGIIVIIFFIGHYVWLLNIHSYRDYSGSRQNGTKKTT